MRHAILNGKEVVPADLMTWAMWLENNPQQKRVAETFMDDGTRISTVFLGLDHSFHPGVKLWFETMVFGGDLDGEMNRYETYQQAEAGHAVMIKQVKEAMG